MMGRTRVGLVFILAPLIALFSIFILFSISHAVFLYYDFFKEEVMWSPVIALISIIAFIPLFHLAWLVVIVGLILIATDARKHANLGRSMLCMLLWFLFIPAFYGSAYLVLRLGIDVFELYFLMIIIIAVCLWITLPLFLPLLSMMGRKYLKRCLILLPFCAIPAFIFSFTKHSEETMFAFLFMEVFYLYTLMTLIVGYLGFYRWIGTIPRNLKGEEILVHKYLYWHEEGHPIPHQIISHSDSEFITLTVKPVPKESPMPARSIKMSTGALAVTLVYSINCLVLKSSIEWIVTVRRFTVPMLGITSMFLILIALAYSGYAMYNIKSNNFKEDRRARIALMMAVGTSLFFLALTMSIGLYLY